MMDSGNNYPLVEPFVCFCRNLFSGFPFKYHQRYYGRCERWSIRPALYVPTELDLLLLTYLGSTYPTSLGRV